MNRRTIKNTFTLEGIGLHTGRFSKLTFKPMEENKGVVFVKNFEGERVEIKAESNNILTTNRSTTIGYKGHKVITTEHLMSAVYALQIDDIYIEVDGDEIPILNGSADIFFDALKKSEIVEKDSERDYFVVDEIFKFKVEETDSEFICIPAEKFEARALVDFESDFVGTQFAEISDLSEFGSELSSCRTFGFFSEVESLLDQGLIQGGNLDNALVIADKMLSEEDIERFAAKLNIEKIDIEKEGIISTIPLKFSNEPARHKLLDFIGDISLLGVPIKGKIIAKRPGHRANMEFAKFLKKKYVLQRKLKGRPVYDPSTKPIFDTTQIMKFLPHRHPFLLVDKVIEMSDTHIVGVKNLTFNETFFQGHFPNNPVFPGVLQIEALAQTGGILAINLQENPNNWDTYFLKMNNVKFKSMAVPGDTLIMKLELLEPIRRGIVHMHGIAYTANRIVSEGDFLAKISEKQQ